VRNPIRASGRFRSSPRSFAADRMAAIINNAPKGPERAVTRVHFGWST
jgi:hypothetical protein